MSRWTFKRWIFWIMLLSLTLVGVAGVSVSLGAVTIPLSKSWSILLHRLLGLTSEGGWTASESSIILELRLPRTISGVLVGAALSLAGAVLQALLRNPLADPFVLGISSGAAVGAVLAILVGLGSTFLGSYAVPGTAFGGALLTLLLVYFIARVEGHHVFDFRNQQRTDPQRHVLADGKPGILGRSIPGGHFPLFPGGQRRSFPLS
ncbi:MAG: iron ABC transporter permease [Thermodesulfobacteriota bacterium]